MALGRSLSLAAYLALARRGPKQAAAFPAARPEGTLLWGHATSPARATALLQIAVRLRQQRPDLNLLLTAPPELERPEHLRGRDFFQHLPADTMADVDGFLDHWRPDLCLWTGGYFRPALIYQAARREVPLFLIDASERGLNASHQRWLPELVRANLKAFEVYFARSGTAAQVLRRLGIAGDDIEVTGPLQEGSAALPCREQDREDMAQALAGRPVWLAAMTQKDEIFHVLAAHRELSRLALRLLMILVPDDETEGREFRQMLHDTGFRTAVWSEGEMPDETTQILLADTRGEMGLWYRLAPVTFMGSSLMPGHGGRDPYEPAALGSAILYGPNVGRYLAAYSRFAAAGAARIVKDSESLAAAVQQCLAPDKAAQMATAGWEVASEGAEVTDRVIDLVQLFNLIYIYAGQVKRRNDFVIEVNPRHVAFYQRLLKFDQLGPERHPFAREARAAGYMAAIDSELRLFFCLPFAHSENADDQDVSVELNAHLGQPWLAHAQGHRDIIRRFGRFPHRNAVLGRDTTADEQAFLDGGGFAG